MENNQAIDDIRRMLAEKDYESLREFCENEHPADVADLLVSLSPQEVREVLIHIDKSAGAEIFSHIEESFQLEVIDISDKEEISGLFSNMPPDDRTDLFKELSEDLQASVLSSLPEEERENINKLSSYAEGTAGSIMTSDYAVLFPQMTAAEAIEHLRKVAPRKETIYYSYVVNDERKLLGFVSLKDLIVASPEELIKDIMHCEIIFARVEDDQEEVAQKIQKYDLLALPIINGNDALVGIITHDDAADVVTQEYNEDIEKFMAITGSHEAGTYLKTSTWEHCKNRITWVVGLAVLGLISGFIIHHFEDTLTNLLILAFYMPMVADTGGNVGSQSATVIVRALALGEIGPGDIFKILFKELKISLIIGCALGMLAWGKVMFLSQNTDIPYGFSLIKIALTIGLAISLQVITSALVGTILPLTAARMKLDPAVVASPALTTVVDITGLLIYFSTAKLLLAI